LILAIWNGIEASRAVVGNIRHAAVPHMGVGRDGLLLLR
jgi:hypothetical protein